MCSATWNLQNHYVASIYVFEKGSLTINGKDATISQKSVTLVRFVKRNSIVTAVCSSTIPLQLGSEALKVKAEKILFENVEEGCWLRVLD